jgi:hypothetical protein
MPPKYREVMLYLLLLVKHTIPLVTEQELQLRAIILAASDEIRKTRKSPSFATAWVFPVPLLLLTDM